MPSSRDKSELPDVDGLRRLLHFLAMLDAILCDDCSNGITPSDAHWADGQMMGSMRNGSGDSFSLPPSISSGVF